MMRFISSAFHRMPETLRAEQMSEKKIPMSDLELRRNGKTVEM